MPEVKMDKVYQSKEELLAVAQEIWQRKRELPKPMVDEFGFYGVIAMEFGAYIHRKIPEHAFCAACAHDNRDQAICQCMNDVAKVRIEPNTYSVEWPE